MACDSARATVLLPEAGTPLTSTARFMRMLRFSFGKRAEACADDAGAVAEARRPTGIDTTPLRPESSQRLVHGYAKAAAEHHQVGIEDRNRRVDGDTHRRRPRPPARLLRLHRHPKTAQADFHRRRCSKAGIGDVAAERGAGLVVSMQPRLPHKHGSPPLLTVM